MPFDDARLADLLAERHGDLARRYADVDDHPEDPTDASQFEPPAGASLMAVVAGVPAACGAVRRLDHLTAEIKRMYVVEAFRRRGLATAVILALEDHARRLGYEVVRVETGTLQPEAIGFYEANGYRRIDCYAQWSGYPLSVCYEKELRVVPSRKR